MFLDMLPILCKTPPMIFRLTLIVTLAALAIPAQAKRVVVDGKNILASAKEENLAREAKRCTQHFAKHERHQGIPKHLLAAIATTESGRYHKGLGIMLPWPWTANVEGKGYYFNSKSEALTKIRAFQAEGKKSIDVGCMQVNLKHHPNAFANLDQAFDPAYNVAYAAKFLRNNYLDSGDWKKAASYYHSKTPEKGATYFSHVSRHWKKLTSKLGGTKEYALARQTPQRVREPKRYNSIQVGNVKSKVSDVLVIRPTTNSRAAVSAAPVVDKSKSPIDLKPTTHAGLQLSVSSDRGIDVIRASSPSAAATSKGAVTAGEQSVFIFQ